MSEDAHARPTRDAPEQLYDVNIPTPTHAERARTLVAQISTGTLCTVALEPEGYPYGSFVTVAFDGENPIFLISGLAEHTKNLERDPRASLLVAEGGSADPLANGRVTLLGRPRSSTRQSVCAIPHQSTPHRRSRPTLRARALITLSPASSTLRH
jgi:heme oxygenase (biliverdin-IX-beta and delta-forming)